MMSSKPFYGKETSCGVQGDWSNLSQKVPNLKLSFRLTVLDLFPSVSSLGVGSSRAKSD